MSHHHGDSQDIDPNILADFYSFDQEQTHRTKQLQQNPCQLKKTPYVAKLERIKSAILNQQVRVSPHYIIQERVPPKSSQQIELRSAIPGSGPPLRSQSYMGQNPPPVTAVQLQRAEENRKRALARLNQTKAIKQTNNTPMQQRPSNVMGPSYQAMYKY
jgi:hypothetical protein